MIVDTNGNQIHISYDADTIQDPTGVWYPRDLVPGQITWDSPTCHSNFSQTTVMCSGANWQPLMRVVFHHAQTVAHPYAGAPSCGAQSNGLRCDDPYPKGSNPLPPGVNIDNGTPQLTQTQVLNNLEVDLNTGGTWNQLRNYQFSYAQSALNPDEIDDPHTGDTLSVAGYLLLDQLQETGTTANSGDPTYAPQTFQYAIGAGDSEYYEDSNSGVLNQPYDCGPSWNTGKLSNGTSPKGCLLWSRSYNGFYMTEADNGLGMQQSFTWANARTNQHGGASGSDWKDPFSCSTLQQQDGASTPYPCDMADDNGWSHIVLTNKTVTENSPTSANANAQTTGTWNYRYFLNQLTAKECSNCAVGMYWGNANSGDWADYYNGKFVGFGLSIVTNPDGSSIDYGYGSTEGWGLYDTGQVTTCLDGGYCANSPMWDYANATSGQPTLELTYAPQDQDGTWHVLKEITTSYWVFCNTGTPPTVFGSWDGYLVAQPEPDNPVVSCDVNQTNIQTYLVDGTYNNYTLSNITASTVPYSQKVTNYDWYFFPTNQIVTGNDLTSTPTTTTTWTYLRHDGITTAGPAPTGTYIVDAVAQAQVQDGNNTVWSCTNTSFDGQPWATGTSATLTKGLVTGSTSYANCANQTGASTKSTTYNANGDPTTTLDPDANAGLTSHKASTGTCTGFTACTGYDGTFGTLPTTGTNALNQSTTTAFTTTTAFGYGQWPSSATDANGQTTSTTYDVLGRVLSTTAPGETASDTTTSLVYTNVCNATGPQAPCLEVDTTQRLDASTTVTKRDFYDGMGQHVESRSAAPGGQDVVQYALYDSEGRLYFQSQAYFVTAYTGAPGAAAYSVPDVSKLGTTTTYDGLGRVTIATDATGKTTNTYYSMVCGPAGTTNDQACYSSTTTIDPNGHKRLGYTDALGRGIYAQSFTGNSSGTYMPSIAPAKRSMTCWGTRPARPLPTAPIRPRRPITT